MSRMPFKERRDPTTAWIVRRFCIGCEGEIESIGRTRVNLDGATVQQHVCSGCGNVYEFEHAYPLFTTEPVTPEPSPR